MSHGRATRSASHSLVTRIALTFASSLAIAASASAQASLVVAGAAPARPAAWTGGAEGADAPDRVRALPAPRRDRKAARLECAGVASAGGVVGSLTGALLGWVAYTVVLSPWAPPQDGERALRNRWIRSGAILGTATGATLSWRDCRQD